MQLSDQCVYQIQSNPIQCSQKKFLLDESYKASLKESRQVLQSISHCKRHKSFPLLGRLKTVLQLFKLSLNSNDPLFHLAPGSLVHHRHLSTTVRAKKLVVMVALWMVMVMRMGIVVVEIEMACKHSLSECLLQQTSPFHLSTANKQLFPGQ